MWLPFKRIGLNGNILYLEYIEGSTSRLKGIQITVLVQYLQQFCCKFALISLDCPDKLKLPW